MVDFLNFLVHESDSLLTCWYLIVRQEYAITVHCWRNLTWNMNWTDVADSGTISATTFTHSCTFIAVGDDHKSNSIVNGDATTVWGLAWHWLWSLNDHFKFYWHRSWDERVPINNEWLAVTSDKWRRHRPPLSVSDANWSPRSARRISNRPPLHSDMEHKNALSPSV